MIRRRLDFTLVRWLLQFARHRHLQPMMRGIPVVRDLCQASLALYEELVRDEKLKFYFEQRGALYVNSTDAGFEKSRRDAALLAEHGLEVRILTGREDYEIEQAVLGSAAGAAYYPEDAHGDSHLFVTSLGSLLPNLGVAVHAHTAATALFMNDRDQADVTTDRGVFQCRDLVVATGSWTPKLTRLLGVDVPVQPGKGYSVTIPKPSCAPRMPVAHQEKKVLVTPIGDRLRFAGTIEFAGLDLRMNHTRSEGALRAGREILQTFAEPPDMERWCGLQPCTPDGIPIVDRIPRHANITSTLRQGTLCSAIQWGRSLAS